jgi:thiamine kinase-like enzyme
MKSLSEGGSIAIAMKKIFETFLDALRTFDECSKFVEKISKWNMEKLVNSWSKSTEPMKCGFITVNHGDLWVNNILLSASDTQFIDFQMTFWGSPSADLLYFLITSIADDYKVKHFDDFVELYYHELKMSLTKLNYTQCIPTLNELCKDMLDKGTFGKNKIYFNKDLIKFDNYSLFTSHISPFDC